jgi:hypothetical protein
VNGGERGQRSVASAASRFVSKDLATVRVAESVFR